MNNPIYISEEDIFRTVRQVADSMTQLHIADLLGCSQPAVSQMLAGNPNMISLALRFLEKTGHPMNFQKNGEGKPTRYFKRLE